MHGLPPKPVTIENATKIGKIFVSLKEVDLRLGKGYDWPVIMRLKVEIWMENSILVGFNE